LNYIFFIDPMTTAVPALKHYKRSPFLFLYITSWIVITLSSIEYSGCCSKYVYD
jgi:hypothetical protein